MTRRYPLAIVLVAAVVFAVLAVSGRPSVAEDSSGLLHPLILGWEQFFKLDWQSEQRGGQPIVYGHVYNSWGKAASRMQLLVEGLDSTGRVTEQQISWLPGTTLTPGMRAWFEVRVSQPAATYRVSVFAFDWLERGRKSF